MLQIPDLVFFPCVSFEVAWGDPAWLRPPAASRRFASDLLKKARRQKKEKENTTLCGGLRSIREVRAGDEECDADTQIQQGEKQAPQTLRLLVRQEDCHPTRPDPTRTSSLQHTRAHTLTQWRPIDFSEIAQPAHTAKCFLTCALQGVHFAPLYATVNPVMRRNKWANQNEPRQSSRNEALTSRWDYKTLFCGYSGFYNFLQKKKSMTESCQKLCYELRFRSQSCRLPFILLLLSWGEIFYFFLAHVRFFSAVPRVATRGKFARRHIAILPYTSYNTFLFALDWGGVGGGGTGASPRQAGGLAALCCLSCYCCTSGTGNLYPGPVTVDAAGGALGFWSSRCGDAIIGRGLRGTATCLCRWFRLLSKERQHRSG